MEPPSYLTGCNVLPRAPIPTWLSCTDWTSAELCHYRSDKCNKCGLVSPDPTAQKRTRPCEPTNAQCFPLTQSPQQVDRQGHSDRHQAQARSEWCEWARSCPQSALSLPTACLLRHARDRSEMRTSTFLIPLMHASTRVNAGFLASVSASPLHATAAQRLLYPSLRPPKPSRPGCHRGARQRVPRYLIPLTPSNIMSRVSSAFGLVVS